jgi:PH domain
LPQLAHLIIHLDTDWPSQSLERLAVILSQTSIHTALQLLFMFIAAMEDYQLENADGKVNPTANLDYYLRCSRLIHNVERAVVYGSPVLSAQAKPRPTSMRRPDPTVKVDATLLHGMLLYKRVLRKSSLSTKTWKSRYFKVEHRILFCYKDDESKVPLRSIVIRDFDLNIVAREKYQFQFELFSKITGVTFKLRADTEATFDFWVQGLRRLDESHITISSL